MVFETVNTMAGRAISGGLHTSPHGAGALDEHGRLADDRIHPSRLNPRISLPLDKQILAV
jgi:hypothetical protein